MADASTHFQAANENALHQELRYLAQHNANIPYRDIRSQAQDNGDQSLATSSQHHSYDSPAPHWQNNMPLGLVEGANHFHEGAPTYGDVANHETRYAHQGPNEHVGLGIHYHAPSQSNESYPSPDQHDYDLSHLEQQSMANQAQVHSPPTPSTAEQGVTTRRTRSGRVVGRIDTTQGRGGAHQEKAKVTKSPSSKRNARPAKREKPKTPQLTAPLSEMTQGYTHIPIRDMEEWVNRPAEVRWQEVKKRNGKVARPMNSFMLYRSAYAERTKMWCLQNNHQVVSSVSGESWPLESAEIRNRYNEYAKIERENHQHAHPGYKFSPSKPNNAKKKKAGNAELDASEPSEVDALEFDWARDDDGSNGMNGSRRSARMAAALNGHASIPDLRARPFPSGVGAHQSSYQAINPGKPAPSVMEPHDVYGYYYQTAVYPSLTAPFVEDVRMQKTEVPESGFNEYHGLVGLPGASHHDLFPPGDSSLGSDEHVVDPMLLTSMPELGQASATAPMMQGHDAALSGLSSTYGTEAGFGMSLDSMRAPQQQGMDAGAYAESYQEQPAVLQANMQHMPGQHDQWQSGLDMGAEFERWYNEEK